MKILIPVKRVIDYNIRVRVKADKSGVELANVKMAMNPFDEIAAEEAIRIREAGKADETVAVSIGPDAAVETIRNALAMGVDRGIHIPADGQVEPLAVAKILAAIVEREKADCVIMGKQAIDDDSNQTGQMLAALLGRSLATFASAIAIDDGRITVARETDNGIEHITAPLPAVVTCDLRLNAPRYASLPNIMKAKKKPVETITLDDLGVDTAPRLEILEVTEPPARKQGIEVASAAELVDKLKNEARVI